MNRDYKWFVVADTARGPKIASGWEYREDAADDLRENGPHYGGGKIVAKSRLINVALAPMEKASWANESDFGAGRGVGALAGAGLGATAKNHLTMAENRLEEVNVLVGYLKRNPEGVDASQLILKALAGFELLGAAHAHINSQSGRTTLYQRIDMIRAGLRSHVADWLQDV